MSNLGGGFQGIAPRMIGGGSGRNGSGGMIGSSERAQDRFSLVISLTRFTIQLCWRVTSSRRRR